MPYLQSNALPRDRVAALGCAVSDFGDLVCPHCTCHIITPPYALVKPGWGRCPCCHGCVGGPDTGGPDLANARRFAYHLDCALRISDFGLRIRVAGEPSWSWAWPSANVVQSKGLRPGLRLIRVHGIE